VLFTVKKKKPIVLQESNSLEKNKKPFVLLKVDVSINKIWINVCTYCVSVSFSS